jgi:chromosome segregation protein
VHLRAVKLRGFKSFPDPVEIRLEPGVGVIVGPNGSGKSNVSDAIRWAAGSLSPSELRAERPDDVLFAGGGGRGSADFCEVELLFDNADGTLPVDYAELAVARRLHRGGEGQYLVNRTAVRRLDLVELLADLGLGQGMHSIISQGKVEAILASRPAERRALIEEAAGLGRFKARRHRAELKLARVAVQVDRARDVEQEVRKRLRPLALQATAAERAQKLVVEIARLRARIAGLDLEALEERLREIETRRTAATSARAAVEQRLEAVLAERNRAEEELADVAGGREQALQALYRLRSAVERLGLRRESAQTTLQRLRDELARPRRVLDERVRVERAALVDEARLLEERLRALDRALAEREGLPPAARALAEEGERIALSLLEVEPGRERAVAAALGRSASAVVRDDAAGALALLERARDAGLGSLVVLVGRDPAQLVSEMPVVQKDELLASPVAAVTPEGFGYDPQRGELWFAGETAEALLLELQARRRELASELDERRARLDAPIRDSAYSLERDPVAERGTELAERLVRALEFSAARFEEPLRTGVEGGVAHTGELGAELRRLGASEVELRQELAAAAETVSSVSVESARVEAEADEARRRLEQADADEPAEGDDREALAVALERLERRRETLGQVNPLAQEEYEAEKEHLAELAAQREDLETSLSELEKLSSELAETVQRRFDETFAAVQRNFEEVAATLFPGGEGRLRLTEAAEAEDEAPAAEGGHALRPGGGGSADAASSQGVEVELRPVGKRVQRLSLLSGGEKALGAIAFLFSLFLARPCPFYLLDEVEAALDDTNIGRFVELLRSYSDRAQFVVITHQKRTMEAADVLYGVTMGNDGVSQVVSRRLPRDEAEAASAA